MTKPLHAGCALALAAALQFTPMIASAALVPATGQPTQALKALDFLSQSMAQTPSLTDLGGTGTPGAAASGDDNPRAHRLGYAVGQLLEPPKQRRGDVDLFLFNLLSIVHAQKSGRPFQELDSRREYEERADRLENNQAPGAVPLPGAVWLFLMGALGLFGSRITGISGTAAAKSRQGQGQGQGQGQRDAPMGGLAPA